jgi:hypothetical protein
MIAALQQNNRLGEADNNDGKEAKLAGHVPEPRPQDQNTCDDLSGERRETAGHCQLV